MKYSPQFRHSAGIVLSVLGLLCAAIAPMGCEDEDSKPNAPTPLPATHTVTFDLNGGQGKVNTLIVPSGQKAQEPSEAPTRKGYTFEGWLTDKDDPDALYDFSASVADDVALYAYWKEIVTYTVTFDVKGGEETLDPQTLKEGGLVTRPPPPTQEGYSFEGWFTDDDTFQNVFDFETLITSDTILYAKWEPIPKKFWVPDANFRKALKALIPDAFDPLDSLITNQSPVTQLTFLDVSRLSIADLTGIAYFTALDTLGCSGNELKELDVSKNTALRLLYCSRNDLTTLDLSQHTALGELSCESNMLTKLNVSENAALKALFCSHNKLTELDVSHNTQLETLHCSLNQLKTLNVSKNTSLTELYCRNNSLADLDIRGMRLTSGLDIYSALFNQVVALTSLRVHEDLRNHEQIKGIKTLRDHALTIETYSADAGSTIYTLECGDYDPHAETCRSSTLLASFTLDFQTDGGSEVASQSVRDGKLAADPREPTRKGYVFGGWFTDKAFQNAFDFTEPITGDLILYAKWIKEHTVTFELSQEQDAIPPQTVQDGELATAPTVPDRPGYIIRNWFTDKAYQDAFDFSTPITGDLVLYARRERRLSYTVTFDVNGGYGNDTPQTVEEGGTATEPPRPIRRRYTFLGWSADTTLQHAFDFTTPVTGNLILYARWENVEKFWIPDDNFRNKLKSLIPDAFDLFDSLIANHIDVQRREILRLNSAFIADLTGIEHFTSLTHLFCVGNDLTVLDVSKNTRLEWLNCGYNALTSLDLSQNAALNTLECHFNSLDSLDLSKNTALSRLYTFGNKLVYMDIRGMRTVDGNALSIDIDAQLHVLTTLKAHENIKDHKGLKAIKTRRGDALTIETYRADAGSTVYTLECDDYDPNAGVCNMP